MGAGQNWRPGARRVTQSGHQLPGDGLKRRLVRQLATALRQQSRATHRRARIRTAACSRHLAQFKSAIRVSLKANYGYDTREYFHSDHSVARVHADQRRGRRSCDRHKWIALKSWPIRTGHPQHESNSISPGAPHRSHVRTENSLCSRASQAYWKASSQHKIVLDEASPTARGFSRDLFEGC